jgi:hypothetical protein
MQYVISRKKNGKVWKLGVISPMQMGKAWGSDFIQTQVISTDSLPIFRALSIITLKKILYLI